MRSHPVVGFHVTSVHSMPDFFFIAPPYENHVPRISYHDLMADPVSEALRRMSRAAFGQTYRLEVMLAIADADDGLVTQTDLARSLGVSTSNVQGAVKSLTECGLLTPLPQGDSRSKFLMRNRSAAWDWVREMRDQSFAANEVYSGVPSS